MLIYPNLRHLHAFVAAARRGSLRAAASEIRLGEPAISQAIARLEQQVGARLLDRTTRSLHLTQAGKVLLPAAERALASLRDATDHIDVASMATRRELSLWSISSVACRLLPPLVSAFRARHPEIRVRVCDDNSLGIQAALRAGEADLGLVGEPRHRGEFRFVPLFDEAFYVVCPRHHPLERKKAPIAGRELAECDLVLMHADVGIRRVLDRCFAQAGLPSLRPAHEVRHLHTVLGMVEHGMGVSALPGLACPHPGHGAIARLPLVSPSVARRIGVLLPAEQRLPGGAAEAFLDLLQSDMGQHLISVALTRGPPHDSAAG